MRRLISRETLGIYQDALFYGFFKFVACFECRNSGLRNHDFIPCLWVTSGTTGTFAGLKSAKADQLYFVSAGKCI